MARTVIYSALGDLQLRELHGVPGAGAAR
jgi:hypothetical protein